jgi:tetratricopeptide (TPR) repeat protein
MVISPFICPLQEIVVQGAAESTAGQQYNRSRIPAVNASHSSPSLPGQLSRLEQANLIRLASTQPELAYLFRHALVQESVYQTLVRVDRRRVHRAVGEALEALLAGREPPAELAPLLARHFQEAGDHARALRYYTLAGDLARAVAAYGSALAAAERISVGASAAAPAAVPAAAWQHLFEARGRALELNAQYDEALANYRAMASRAQALADPHLVLAATVAESQLYATPTILFDLPRAEQMVQAALAEARALGDEPVEAKILWAQINLFRFTRRVDQARECGEQSLAIARRLGLTAQAAATFNDLVHIYATLGRWPEFEQASAEAQRLWRALGNSAMLADSLSSASLYANMRGQFALALSQAAEAHQLALAIGNLWGQSFSLSNMCWPYWYLGRPDRALETITEAVRLGRESWPFAAVAGGAWRAFMHSELGDLAGGWELERAAAEAGEHVGNVGVKMVVTARIHLELLSASVSQAAATLNEMDQAGEESMPLELAGVLRARAEVVLAEGDAARALALTQAHVAQLRQMGLLAYLPEALSRLAQALRLHGRVDQARASLLEALAQAQSMEAAMLEWRVLYDLGRLELEQGRPAAAQPHWGRALAIVTTIADHAPTAALRQSFLARPEVRALRAGAV